MQLPNGIIINAPHIQNNSGRHPKSTFVDTRALRVTYDETDGFVGNQPVRYLSTDASTELLAAAENVIFAPALGNIRGPATAGLALLDDGQTGRNNVQRQGFDAAIFDRLDPLNVLEFTPFQAGYSPIWEVEPHRWAPALIAAGQNLRQRDYLVVEAKEAAGQLLVVPEDPNAPAKVVNCPIVSRRSDAVPPGLTLVLAAFGVTAYERAPAILTLEVVAPPDDSQVIADAQVSATILSETGQPVPNATVVFSYEGRRGSCVTSSFGSCVWGFTTQQGVVSGTVSVLAVNRMQSFVRAEDNVSFEVIRFFF